MRLLNCVLTILAVFVAGIAGSTTTGGDSSTVAARTTSSASSHTNETLFVASSPGRLHEHAVSKIKQEDQLDEERTAPSLGEVIANVIGSPTTSKLVKSIGQRMETEKLIENGKVNDLNKFAELLGDKLLLADSRMNHGEVVKVLTTRKINKGLLAPFHPEELAEVFHSLRKYPNMKEHADHLQGTLAAKNPALLESKLFGLWSHDALAPDDVFKILTSGFSYKAPDVSVSYNHKRMVKTNDLVYKPLVRYIDIYKGEGHVYSEDDATRLLSVFTEYPAFTFGLPQASEKTPKHGTNE